MAATRMMKGRDPITGMLAWIEVPTDTMMNWQPLVSPEEFPNTVEGLQAYQDALDPFVVGPEAGSDGYINEYGIAQAHSPLELAAMNFGGYGDGTGPVGPDGRPSDLTRNDNYHQTTSYGFNPIATRARVRPEEAMDAFFAVNPDGTPVLSDQAMSAINAVLQETLGPDWLEVAYDERRGEIDIPTIGDSEGVLPGSQGPFQGGNYGIGMGVGQDVDPATLPGSQGPLQGGNYGIGMGVEQNSPPPPSGTGVTGTSPIPGPADVGSGGLFGDRDPTADMAWNAGAPAPAGDNRQLHSFQQPAQTFNTSVYATPAPTTPTQQTGGETDFTVTDGVPVSLPAPEESSWAFDPVTGLYCNALTGVCV